MARQSSDREDLLAEASALVERVELRAGDDPPVVVGFHRDGAASFYFGSDPVYQFNAERHLRRMFVGGDAFKAEAARLLRLERKHVGGRVELTTHEVDAEHSAALVAEMSRHLGGLRSALESGNVQCLRQVPIDADVRERVHRWLTALAEPLKIASRAQL